MQLSEIFFNRHIPNPVQYYGLEVELEDAPRVETPSGWNATTDGSLRNGIEYVLAGPKSLNASTAALVRLRDIIERSTCSIRCSFHVHVDVRSWTMTELANVLRCYVTFEHEFFALSGSRSGSQFCTPVVGSSVEANVRQIIRDEQYQHQNFDRVKYSALNIGHVDGFGSLEFRHHKGLESSGEGVVWLSTIAGFCAIARTVSRSDLRNALCDPTGEALHNLRLSLIPEGRLPEVDVAKCLYNFKATELGYN